MWCRFRGSRSALKPLFSRAVCTVAWNASEAVDVDVGQLDGRRLKNCPVVVDLDEFSPVGGWATGGRDGRLFERFAEMCQDLPDRPRLGNERDEPDVATTPRALERKLLAHAGHEFGPRNPGGVVGGGLSHESQRSPVVSPPAACPSNACPPVAASRRLPTFAFVMSRDGRPELVIRGEHPLIAMPVLPRRRHEIGQPVQEVKRQEFDDAVNARPRGLAPAPTQLAALCQGSGSHQAARARMAVQP